MSEIMRKNTNAMLRGGTTRSSGEGRVMGLERRGCAVVLIVIINW
jgi:hypothetical protein